jgi:STAS-like domain of unknown function (DUF4325)
MQQTIHKIKIAKDFSETPGPRSKAEGDFSGEEFLEKILLPAYEQAVADDAIVLVDLDGTEGYATSFLESTFGGLARKFPPEEVLSRITFKSDDEPFLVEEIKKYVREARK